VNYTIFYAPSVRRDMKRLPADVVRRIDAAIMGLSANPRPAGSLKLSGRERLYRQRVGDYRVVYAIDDAGRTVEIRTVANRKEVYRGL
jgi:mRNA interferase RelE/StbE